MNHDLDERMVPNGQYRDALNVSVSTSESSNVGALQNIKGNKEVRNKTQSTLWTDNYINDLTNPICIGTIRNEPTECVYWFIASEASGSTPSISVIAEYNQKTNIVSPVIVDMKDILKFSKDYLITGINIVDDLLFFTDNKTEPKKINLKKFKKGSIDFTTHTKIASYSTSTGLYSSNNTGVDFTESDVTVIKKSPLIPPGLNMSASVADGPGTGLDPVSTTFSANNYYNFTYVVTAAENNASAVYAPLPTYQTWFEDSLLASPVYPANMASVNIVVSQAPTGWAEGDTIVLSGSFVDDYNNVDEYKIRLILDQINGQSITCKIESIPSKISRFGQDGEELIVWEVLLEEKDPMFEFDFPRFAYRWKYENGEYSCFSPFTQVAFLGGDFEYLSSDGFNVGMKNNLRSLDINALDWGSSEVVELDVLYKKSTSNNIYVVDTLKDRTVSFLNIKSELIGATVEANQLLRPWDNVPRVAKAQEVSANRLIYANYLQNFNVPTIGLKLMTSLNTHAGNINSDSDDPDENPLQNNPLASIKALRNYQLGIVLQDAYGRQTPVFTSPSATIRIDKDSASGVNKFIAEVPPLLSTLPSWVTHYKYFIKDISNEYYNLALDRFYFAEDGNVWLSFPSSEVSKVQIDSYLILKKQHDVSNASVGPCRYKVLDVQSKAPEFISKSKKIIASAQCDVLNGFKEGFSKIQFDGPDADENSQFATAFNGDSFITISDGTNTTEIVGVKFGGPIGSGDQYEVTLDNALDSTSQWMGTAGLPTNSSVKINVFKEEPESLPEFEGRFFVKINRDTDFEVNIVKTFASLKKRYGIVSNVIAQRVQQSTNTCTGSGDPGRWGVHYADNGERQGSDCAGNYKCNGIDTGTNGTHWYDGPSQFVGSPANSPGIFGPNYYAGAKTGRKELGISYVGGGSWEGAGPRGNGLYGDFFKSAANAGALIRINHIDGRTSQIYEIEKIYRMYGRRGKKKRLGSCCSGCQRNYSCNKSYRVAMILTKPVSEDWVGDGSFTQLANIAGFEIMEEIISDDNKILSSTNPAVFETEPKEAIDIDIYYEASKAFPVSLINTQASILDYFNCFSFGNGVESDRIRDDFNAPKIGKGVKVSTILDEPYMEERRSSGLIFSQIYNSQSGVNRLNQFIQALPITKDLNPEYGSIQKLHSKNTNLVTLCEDKCLSILANKDALFNADGSTNIVSNKAVLGQAQPYAGEFGISTNPESFASYGFRTYFSDKNRGAVIRLSQDGITNIALKGMTDFFADNLPLCTKIIGSYNDDKENYNITLDKLTEEWQDKFSKTPKDKTHCQGFTDDQSDDVETTTVSFKETVGGWPSRKSYYSKIGSKFYPLEAGVSINDKYYTFNQGYLWEHNSNDVYNNFYGTQYDSSVNVIINDATEAIKGFKTLNYSGSQSRKYTYGTTAGLTGLSIAQLVDQRIVPSTINSEAFTPGWYTNYINTDMEEGQIKEFIRKENKYFNKIKGISTYYNDNCDNNVDSSSFPTQGLGTSVVTGGATLVYNLNIKFDASCATEGNVNPDTTKPFFWNFLAKGLNLDIRQKTTDLLVKCGIEDFYNSYGTSYNDIQKFSTSFKFYNSQGINVNTQIFDENNNQLTTLSGKYLYVDPASTPDNAALNANVTGTSVPNTYFILTITNGVITFKKQYNTLGTCGTPDPDAEIYTQQGIFAQGTTLNWNTKFSGTAAASRAAATKTGIINYLAPYHFCNNGAYFEEVKYLASAGIAVGVTLYYEDGTSFGSKDGILVYNTAQTWNGTTYSNAGISKSYLLSNATWATIPASYKFITYENGVVTHITTMNTL